MRLLISAGASSAGKTTLAMLVAAHARGRGLAVAPYKCGPDFIDGQYLEAASGRPCFNLDEWMTGGPKGVLRSFALGADGAQLAVIEGVMGLYDGKKGEPFGAYSSAATAKILKAPVVICLSARKSGVTLATQLLGLMKADPKLQIVGAVLNDCGSRKLYDYLAPAVSKLCGVPCFGYLPRIQELVLPERHLGLSPPSEQQAWKRRFEAGLALAAETLDFKGLLKAAKAPALMLPKIKAVPQGKPRVKIGLARDAAFHFYYRENLRLLEEAGAELVEFSPLADARLPAGIQGLILGGGFPELFGAELSRNEGLRREIGARVLEGLPVWAECGGLMYLCGGLSDLLGKRHAMAGALAADVLMTKKLQNFGYAEAKAIRDSPPLAKGAVLRGHEFHHSEIFWREKPKSAWKISQPGKPARDEGYLLPRGLATYFHAHLAKTPASAARFVAACKNVLKPGNV
jgi:cobyrinic acid a,c-diamide synthase